MLEYLIAFSGSVIGVLIAYFCREELEKGEKYFKIITILTLVIIVLFNIKNANYLLLSAGIVLGYVLNKEYLFFSFLTNNFYTLLTIFIHGLPYGALKYNRKREIIYNAGYFFIPLIFFSFVDLELVQFGVGGIFGILIKKGLNLFSKS